MEDKVIWQLTEEDFRSVITDSYPDLTEEQVDALINKAYDKFNIVDWTEQVEAFISAWIDLLEFNAGE